MDDGFLNKFGVTAAVEGNGTHVPKKHPPSVISGHLRDELIRILTTGDDQNEGAFTVAVALQVEKFAVAAREILMTEKLSQNDLGSLMRMRRPPYASPFGGSLITGTIADGDYGSVIPSLGSNENFGVQAIRQLVDAFRTASESPAKLVEALAVARSNNLTDVVEALEKKLGVSKEEVPSDKTNNPDIVDPRGPLQ